MELRHVKISGGWKIELVENGESISRLWIVDRRMRIGQETVKLGGIAGVGTLPSHRRRGLASQVLNAAVAWMERQGYDASLLYGIPDFYHRFGYATCMAEHRQTLDTRDAERATGKLRLRRPKKGAALPEDLRQVSRLYRRDNARRTASVLRQRDWDGFPMASGFGVDPHLRLAVDGRDRVLGYVVYDDRQDRCRAAEIGGEGAEVFGSILRFLARRAVALRRERLSFSMPSDHPFALYARRFGLSCATEWPRNAGPMGRIINLQSCLAALGPEWQRRWPDGGAASLRLRTDLGVVRLEKDGAVSQAGGSGGIALKQHGLMQLLMGYRSVGDLYGGGELSGSPAQRGLLTALTPLQEAHMWWPDRF